MAFNVYYTHSHDKTNIHLENSGRIELPVEYLKKAVPNKIINSESLYVSGDKIINFLRTVYSSKYISKIDTLDFTKILCKECFEENEYINEECKACNEKLVKKERYRYFDGDKDTMFSEYTYKTIKETMKILINIVNDIQVSQYSYALIRPPGHHSSLDHHEGFCVFNNAYLLARNLINTKSFQKIIILDWDLHHGNGTQHLVNNNMNKDVYYVSLHGFERFFYPGTGSIKENNEYVLNVPLEKGTKDKKYIKEFDEKVVPFIDKLISKIDVIIISNGLDAHRDDQMDFLEISSESYIHMAKYLKKINKKLIFLLEGGYNPKVIAKVSYKIIKMLNEK
jgi:acetoin utilization deacetylase AcuC-like enzyme